MGEPGHQGGKGREAHLRRAKKEIQKWESSGPGFLSRGAGFLLAPANRAAEALIPKGAQEAIGKAIHGFLSGIRSGAEVTINLEEVRGRVSRLSKGTDDSLLGADKAAKHYWNWHLVYGTAEGGVTGAAGFLALAVDIPALFTISLRLIQEIATCYGYDVTEEEEQEYVLHLLRTASTSDIKIKAEVLVTLKQLEQILLKVTWKKMNEALARKEIGKLSLLAGIRQFAKSLGIQLTKRKALQLVPLLGALVGAVFNATFVNDVGRAAYMSYRRRKILEIEGREDEEGVGLQVTS